MAVADCTIGVVPGFRLDNFEVAAARQRCLRFRRRILDLSQKVSAMHIAPAFSCLEMIDTIYHGMMRRAPDGTTPDTFVLSKGHGCMSLFVTLEDMGILPSEDLETYCTPRSHLGGHPDYGTPGIEASTGSLGHGLGIALGMAYADRLKGDDRVVFTLVGDGETQEGSVWEALMMAANLKLDNLVALMDLNNYQGLGKTSETHPHFYPVLDKLVAFGWEAVEVNGHDAEALAAAFRARKGGRPFFLICHTVKGRGVSFMIDEPIWHYRSPNPQEYRQAIENLREVAS